MWNNNIGDSIVYTPGVTVIYESKWGGRESYAHTKVFQSLGINDITCLLLLLCIALLICTEQKKGI